MPLKNSEKIHISVGRHETLRPTTVRLCGCKREKKKVEEIDVVMYRSI